MENKRRRFNGSFKANVALAAVKGDRTMGELASVFGVHANQITKWKRQSLDGVPGIFSERHREDLRQQEALTDRLYQQIGQLKVELDWLKKNLVLTLEEKRAAVERRHPALSLRRQSELLGLSRSSLYYRCEADPSYNEQLTRPDIHELDFSPAGCSSLARPNRLSLRRPAASLCCCPPAPLSLRPNPALS